MKQIMFLAVCTMGLARPTSAQTGLYVPQLADFDTAMQELMAEYDVPGAQLAITYQGRLVYNRGFGYADLVGQDSVRPESTFRIASLSKTLTSVACMKLVEGGQLDLDAQVFGTGGILNDAMYQNILDPLDTTITVRMLLQHTGGWNRDISGDPMFNAFGIAAALGVASPPTAGEVVQYMLTYTMLDFTPGTQSHYSNFGYCVLGRVIEKLTGQPFADYVQGAVLGPLGIVDMQLGRNLAAEQLPYEVNYYDYPGAPLAYSVYDNATLVPWPYGGFNLEFMDAHGGWVASAADLMKFICGIDGFPTRPDILSSDALDTLTAPSALDPNYALGIAVNIYNNWWHLGSLPGTSAEYVRNGNSQINWALLFNTRDQIGAINSAMDGLVWEVLPSITNWPTFDLFTSLGIQGAVAADAALDPSPNPTTGLVHISRKADVELRDILGKTLATGKGVDRFDLTGWPAGVYVLVFTDANGHFLQSNKVVKE